MLRVDSMVVICCVLWVLMLATGCGKQSGGSPAAGGGTGGGSQSVVRGEGGVEKVTVKELLADQALRLSGKPGRPWQGKLIEVKGQILQNQNQGFIRLVEEGANAEGAIDYIHCLFPDNQDNSFDELAPGQIITVRGEAMLGDPFVFNINKCKVIEAGPSPLRRVEALELSREYAADRAAAVKKNAHRQMLVEGIVQEARGENPRENTYMFILEGVKSSSTNLPANVLVQCWCGSDKNREKLKAVTKGQKIKFRGEYMDTGVGPNFRYAIALW